MKQTTKIFGVLSALLLLSVVAVYAHGSTQERTSTDSTYGMMIDVEEMDEMHNLMTEGLDPELKEQMDIMHDGCTSHFKGQEDNEEHMGEFNMMAGRIVNGMMRGSMMMGGGMMG